MLTTHNREPSTRNRDRRASFSYKFPDCVSPALVINSVCNCFFINDSHKHNVSRCCPAAQVTDNWSCLLSLPAVVVVSNILTILLNAQSEAPKFRFEVDTDVTIDTVSLSKMSRPDEQASASLRPMKDTPQAGGEIIMTMTDKTDDGVIRQVAGKLVARGS